jgi:hypothetical protein
MSMTAGQFAKQIGVDVRALPNLTRLDAWGNSGITDAGLSHVPNLTRLDAWGNSGITDAGLSHVPNLTALYAWGNSGITDAGQRMVAARRGV